MATATPVRTACEPDEDAIELSEGSGSSGRRREVAVHVAGTRIGELGSQWLTPPAEAKDHPGIGSLIGIGHPATLQRANLPQGLPSKTS